jgi:hypothetical protein
MFARWAIFAQGLQYRRNPRPATLPPQIPQTRFGMLASAQAARRAQQSHSPFEPMDPGQSCTEHARRAEEGEAARSSRPQLVQRR